LNPRPGVEAVIQQRETENLAGIGSVAAAETMSSVALAETRQRGGSETILLVEDEAFVRRGTAEVLESAGYRLVLARSAAEALEAYGRGSGPLDLLLADVVMPGMNGRELARKFESLDPRTRVLLMSGYAEQFAQCEPSRRGNEYLAKPFSMRTLLTRVRKVLDANPLDLRARA